MLAESGQYSLRTAGPARVHEGRGRGHRGPQHPTPEQRQAVLMDLTPAVASPARRLPRGISKDRFEVVTRGRRLGRRSPLARPPSTRTATRSARGREAMMARPAGSGGKNGTAAAPAARSGPAPRTLTEMPRAGWLAILKRSIREFKHDDVTDRAAALTYFGVLALFPAMLVLVSILGLLGKSATQQVLGNLDQVAPGGVHTFLKTVVTQVQGKAGAAGVAGIIGIVIALWSASGYVAAFMRASNAIYDVDEGRPIWLTGPIASQVGAAFGIGHAAVLIWDIAKWPVLVIIVSVMYSLLYKASPNVRQPAFRWVSAGGILAVIIWLIASVIIFLVWLWISNIAILLGAEFNAETQRERAIRAGMPEDVEPFAELRDTRKLNDPEKRRVEQARRTRDRTMDQER